MCKKKMVNKIMCVNFTKAVNDFQPYYWDVCVYKTYAFSQCHYGRIRIAVYLSEQNEQCIDQYTLTFHEVTADNFSIELHLYR